MSRSGYTDDGDNLAMWRGQVASAIRGRRGQAFLREMVEALDAMPEKRLILHELRKDGEVCALGSVGAKRGIEMEKLDPEDTRSLSTAFGIAHQLVAEIEYMNDEYNDFKWIGNTRIEITPEERWRNMRAWAMKNIQVEP